MKSELLAQLAVLLRTELELLTKSAENARQAATGDESKAENKYDTRGLEASYLAGAQKLRADELESKIQFLAELKCKIFSRDDRIAATAVVELEESGVKTLLFLLNIGAGYDLQWDGRQVKCISTQSVIGQALMGKTIGDFIGAGPVGKEKEYEIIDLIE